MTASSQEDDTRGGQPAPFASLLAISSLVLVVLVVAGFSYQWTYYYNFGLEGLALQMPIQSVAISALELIRTPSDAFHTLCIVVIPLFAINAILSAMTNIGSLVGAKAGGRANRYSSYLGLDNRLVTDSLRAVVLIYSAFWAGSQSGWEKFRIHVSETDLNTLPTVTAVLKAGSQGDAFPFVCKPADWNSPGAAPQSISPIIGNPSAITELRDGRACDIKGSQSWRMLYRDDKFLYLFATGGVGVRPLTLVLPNTDNMILIMGAAANATKP